MAALRLLHVRIHNVATRYKLGAEGAAYFDTAPKNEASCRSFMHKRLSLDRQLI
jgi:hypothetical protein